MGNRAVITFDRNPTPQSIGVYLHWNGGPESVYAFLDALDHYHVRDTSDTSYQLARFIQIVANFLGGTLSIGVAQLKELDCTNDDHGLYAVYRDGEQRIVKRSKGTLTDWWSQSDVDSERTAAYQHSYHTGEHPIAALIHERNDALFRLYKT